MQIKELMNILEDIAPVSLAESYDNPGLLVGGEDSTVKTILIALDLTEAILKEAVEKGVDAIITHHPIIFHPVKSINTGFVEGRILRGLIKNDINYIAMHTNMDKCKGGLNDYLAELAGIKSAKVMEDETECCQISVYVPGTYAQVVKSAMFDAGAGLVGDYKGCVFETSGTGEFEPMEGAIPFTGQVGKTERAEEVKLEVYCDTYRLGKVICAMRSAHPYERPVYYAFKSRSYGEYGFGRHGELEKAMSLKEYCAFIKDALNLPFLEYIGDEKKMIKTVGVCSGAGGDMYETAVKMGLDAFITGDIKHNVAVFASGNDTALINAGHYGTEVIFKNILSSHLQNRFNELKCSVNIIYSQVEKSPWSYV